MKIPTPEEINNKLFLINEKDILLENVINEINNSTTLDWNYNYIVIIIPSEYSKESRDYVVEEFKKVGWKRIEHKTSSENGERLCLTEFKIYKN
jgi:hypothetical protein